MYKFTQGSENINSNAGLSLVSKRLNNNSAFELWNNLGSTASNLKYRNANVIRSMIGMITLGYSDFNDIVKLQNDSLFLKVADGQIPSEATHRQRLESIACEDWQRILDQCVVVELKKTFLTPVLVAGEELIPLDIDVSVFADTSSQKEGIGMTYQKVKGYAPIFCYAGLEGYMVANELRHGSQHSANGAVDFVKRCIDIMTKSGYAAEKLFVRVDSGHDDSAFIEALIKANVKYIVKRNLRRESPYQILDSIRSSADMETNRPGKVTYTGFRSDRKPAGLEEYCGFMAVRAVERTITSQGERLLLPSVDVACWWTNLVVPADECYQLYRDHATSEQFHSELKHDLGIELLPSGKMETNALILGLTTFAHNVLRFIGQSALQMTSQKTKDPEKLPLRYRLRTVLLDYMKVGCKIVSHANRIWLKFGRSCPAFTFLEKIYAMC